MIHYLLTPHRFLRYARVILPISIVITAIAASIGLYTGLVTSPPDYQQGETVRIMYVHVPAAWMALFTYSCIAIASASSLIWKNPMSDTLARSMAPIGACFTAICLITGSLWGHPTWGTWWVWDARLTSMLILFFFYIGYIALAHAYDDYTQGAKMAAILALVGFINVPIVKFSVDWWNTLHQPASILRSGGIAIDPSMRTPLLAMFIAYIGFFNIITIIRARIDIAERKIHRLRLQQLP